MFSLFGSSTMFDIDVEKATSENNTTEQWDVIIDICDKAGSNSKNAKDCLKSIMKRVGNADPHVAIQAITLLDACIKNCGRTFHLEVASRDFESEFQRLMAKVNTPVAQKMRVSLKKWAENEFKTDHVLNLIPSLYMKMKNDGIDFNDTLIDTPQPQAKLSKDPNVVTSQQEEDDIAKAIELSLRDKNDDDTLKAQSLYPTMNIKSSLQKTPKDGRKVRALYDFEAAEDNELTFLSGEIIYVLDDSDSNWWTGCNDRGEGLFPSNFVTADLNAEVHSNHHNGNETGSSENKGNNNQLQPEEGQISIDEMKIDRLLHLLHEANPEDPSQDSQEMYVLEAHVNQMLPLIDNELERVDRNHAKLTQLSTQLVEAINMYHMLMRESDIQAQYASFRQQSSQMFSNNGMYSPYSQIAGPPLPIIGQNQQNQSIQNDNTQLLQQPQPQQQYGSSQYSVQNIHASHMGPYYAQGSTFNSQHAAPQSMLTNHSQIPNTIMTTQVQGAHPQSDQL